MKIAYTKKEIFLNIYFFIFVLAILYMFVNQILYGRSEHAWNVSEWLINYQGGFVRRGLRGEIIYQLYHHFGFDPYTMIRIIAGFSFLLLAFFFVRKFVNQAYPLFILPCVFLIGNPILNGFWLRADCILCLFFIGIVYLIVKKPFLHYVWINLLFIIGLLFHEIFIFIFCPIVVVLLLMNDVKEKSILKKLIKVFIILLPSFLCFLSVFYFNGSEEIVSSIWNSWGPQPFSFDFSDLFFGTQYPGALTALTSNLKEGLLLSAEGLYFFDGGIYGPFMVILMLIAIFSVMMNLDKFDFKIFKYSSKSYYNKSLISSVFIFQFIVTIPLYIIGYDYGRWIFYWTISSFILLFIIPENKLLSIIPDKFLSISYKIGNAFSLSRSFIILVTSLICFSTTFWYLYDIRVSSLYVVLSSISSLLIRIISMF